MRNLLLLLCTTFTLAGCGSATPVCGNSSSSCEDVKNEDGDRTPKPKPSIEAQLTCPESHSLRTSVGAVDVFTVVCTNEGAEPISLVVTGTSKPFGIVSGPPTIVEVGAKAGILVMVLGDTPGTFESTLSFQSGGETLAEVVLEAEVVEPDEFVCTPDVLSFQPVLFGDPTAAEERLTLACTNVGGLPAVPSMMTAPGTGNAFQVDHPSELVMPGAGFSADVTFTPPEPGSFSGVLLLGSGGRFHGVQIEGTALAPPACDLALHPFADGALDFHTLPTSSEQAQQRELVAQVAGEGCEIRNLRLEGGEALFALADETPSLSLPPGEWAIPIDFLPEEPGTFEAALHFLVVGEDTERTIPLTGARDGCLDLLDETGAPAPIATLQDAAAGCVTSPTPIFLHNACGVPVTMTGATIHQRLPAEEASFRIVGLPDLPTDLAPGERVGITVAYENPAHPEGEAGGLTFDLADGKRIWLGLEGTSCESNDMHGGGR